MIDSFDIISKTHRNQKGQFFSLALFLVSSAWLACNFAWLLFRLARLRAKLFFDMSLNFSEILDVFPTLEHQHHYNIFRDCLNANFQTLHNDSPTELYIFKPVTKSDWYNFKMCKIRSKWHWKHETESLLDKFLFI